MNNKKPTNYRWLILFTSIYAYVAYAFSLMGVPPLMAQIIQEFNIGYAQAGLLMSMPVIPGILASLQIGIFVDRHGARMIGSIAAVLVMLGSIMPTIGSSFTVALIGRLILGGGGAIIAIATPAIIPDWFTHKELGKAMGVYTAGMPIATTISFLLATFTTKYGWRYQFYISTALAIANIVLFSLIVKKGPISENKKGENEPGISLGQTLKNIEIWKVGLLWFLFASAVISFTTWAPSVFVEFKELSPAYTNVIMSAFWLIQIPGCLVFGWISDRLGKRKPLMLIGCVSMIALVIPLLYTSNPILIALLTVLYGLLVTMIPPNVMASPPEILGPAAAGIGFGILSICMNAGTGVGPPLVGLPLDLTNSPIISLIAIALFPAIGIIVTYLLKIK
jgi:predicted MFS family arabinose efflux permease